MSKHQKMDDVLVRFEDSRNSHGGVIEHAAQILGMSKSALERALYRAKAKGSQIHFTNSAKKAQYDRRPTVDDAIAMRDSQPATVEHYHEEPLPPRATAVYGTGDN